MEKTKSVSISVEINSEKSKKQVYELIQLLKSANSLVNELAETLSSLEVDIKL